MKNVEKLADPYLLEQLEKIGLHETDALVYLTSIHIGACSINQLTEHTKCNRITVHDSVGRLIKKGLLLETFSGKKRLVFPQQINNLQQIVDTKKAEVDQLQQNVNTTIGLLQSLHLQSSYLPHIRIAKGRTGIQETLQDMSLSKTTNVRIMSDSRHFDELLNIHFLEKMQKNKQQIQMILPAGFEHFIFSAHAKGIAITTKTLAPTIDRHGGMTIWGDKVALHAYEGVYITTTLIENRPIAHMMQACFEAMWR